MSANCTEFEWRDAAATNGDSGVGFVEAFTRIIRRLEKVERICDLGCGNGYLAARLVTLGYEVTGVDASPSGIEIARRSCPRARFVLSRVDEQLYEEVESEAFDLVVSSDVIEHLYRPSDLLEAAARVLKPNGQILIGTPYHGYLKNLALGLSGRMDAHFCVLDDGGHIKFFSVHTLSTLLQRHGFTDLKFNFYGRAPLLWKNMICHAHKRLISCSTSSHR
jgi:2-polyprenyl-3-methyl-5-hydroxy-6-metoxy-1,4-benzoquinol methylase